MRVSPVFLLLLSFLYAPLSYATQYGVARGVTPVLNTAEFSRVFGGADGKSLKTDRCGQVRELEFVALRGTVFRIKGELQRGTLKVYQVETDDYPAVPGGTLFVDSRFIELRKDMPVARVRSLPSRPEIIAAMRSVVGAPYVWGGNVQSGVAELAELFYGSGVAPAARKELTLSGVDCSGLLYQATGGWTPRNTSQLVSYGQAVPVAGKSVDELARLLVPLDLIVWNGHVIIVLDRDTVIESRLECGEPGHGGVKTTPLRQRLAGIMRSRQPADRWPAAGKQRDVFVVRRWMAP